MREVWGHRCGWLVFIGAVVAAGCQSESPAAKRPTASFRGISLQIGALDDHGILAGVAPLRGEWVASRGGDISTRDEALALEAVSTVDVLLFPAQRLGDLVDAGALATIPNELVLPQRQPPADTEEEEPPEPDRAKQAEGDTFQYMDIAPSYRDQVTRYGSERLALPCGGSALVLVYRRDAFERQGNAEAARRAGVALEPPSTWKELDALATFFHGRDWNGEPGADYGIALALGADAEGVADTTFLARAASLGQHRDHYSLLFDSDTMAPRIADPPFLQALEELLALSRLGPPGMQRFDARAARDAFRSGTVAMLIDRAEQAASWSQRRPIGVAPLPGADRVFEPAIKVWQASAPPNAPCYLPRGGGWLVGINRALSGTRLEAAIDFAKYLASPENLNRLRAEPTFPMLPVRASQIGQGLPDPTRAPDVDSRQWSLAVSKTLMAERVVPGLRIPEAGAYLADLAKGRIAALGGEDPQKALQAVAAAWAKRTNARGPKRQLWHYRRSLNGLVTLPQPPEPGN